MAFFHHIMHTWKPCAKVGQRLFKITSYFMCLTLHQSVISGEEAQTSN